MDLEKTLIEKTQTAIKEKETSSAVMEVQKLLEYGTLREAEILRNIGLKSIHARIEKEHGELITFNKIQTATEFSVIKMDHIKEVCGQFRMRYLPCNLYNGYYPPDITAKITKLEKEKTIELRKRNPNAPDYKFDETLLQTKFMILAPDKLFDLVEEEKVNVPRKRFRTATFSFMTDEQWQKWLREEPILFYQEDDNNAILLKKWGNDFTPIRRALGFVTKNWKNLFYTLMISLFVVLSLVGWALIGNLLVAAGSAAIVSFIAACLITPMGDQRFYTENNWNSRFTS